MEKTLSVDLNCDLGESFGRYNLGADDAMMELITSANIACGFHAGDPSVMARTVSLAKQHGVALGAHPGYPDLQGFGRRQMGLTLEDITHILYYQMGALAAFAQSANLRLSHVKPHGALYNLAAQDVPVAQTIAAAVYAYDSALILVGLAGSALILAGEAAGLQVANEGFPDRAYLPNGQLMPRGQIGSVITDPDEVASHAVQLVKNGLTINGDQVRMDTLCLHGDHPHAVANAQRLRRALEDEGIMIRPLIQKEVEN